MNAREWNQAVLANPAEHLARLQRTRNENGLGAVPTFSRPVIGDAADLEPICSDLTLIHSAISKLNIPELDKAIVEKLFDNTRMVFGRKGHPLAKARSLRDLVDAQWVSTSITRHADEELAPMFEQHGLPTPRIAMQAHTALTTIVSVAYSDLLAVLPIQWTQFAVTRDALQVINVNESILAPPICLAWRAGLPLTPAAEHLCDMFRRAAGHLTAPTPKPTRKR